MSWRWCFRVAGIVVVAAVVDVYALAAVAVAVEVLLGWWWCLGGG